MLHSQHIRPILLTLALALVLALSFQGGRGLWGPDEGRYSNIALGMVDSADWLTPRRHPEHTHFTKPPMIYWAIAASVKIFGKNEFALRAPGALALIGCVVLLLALGWRLCAPAPWLPGLIFVTSAVPFAAANWINTDFLLTFFETLAILGFVQLWKARDTRSAGFGRALMWLGFALAFMTKGPPGLLPLLPILVFTRQLSRAQGQERVPRLRLVSWRTLLMFALVAFPWYLAVIARNPGLLSFFLVDEVYGRVFTNMHDRSGGTFGIIKVYAPVVLIGMLPWALVLWQRLPTLWRARGSLRQWWLERAPEDRFLLLWCLLPALVFAVATSKMPLYALPLLVPAAMLIARRLLPLDAARLRRVLAIAGLSAVVLLAGKALAPRIPHEKDARDLATAIRANFAPSPGEIVFIDEPALYGLHFYLGSTIERVALGSEMDFSFDSSLADELLEAEDRVWITTRERIERTQAALGPLGRRFEEKAVMGRYVLGRID